MNCTMHMQRSSDDTKCRIGGSLTSGDVGFKFYDHIDVGRSQPKTELMPCMQMADRANVLWACSWSGDKQNVAAESGEVTKPLL